MLKHKEILQALVARVAARNVVTVTETNFGYVIWSKKGGSADVTRSRLMILGAVACVLFIVGTWLMPMGGQALVLKPLLTVAIIAVAVTAALRTPMNAGGIELHVDLSRREIRAASRTPKGESWIRSSARFGEITNAVLLRPRRESKSQSLVLKVAGEADPLPVAVGKESVLLAVHDRLMKDLRPIEERLAGFRPLATPAKPSRNEVFPSLGPSEVNL